MLAINDRRSSFMLKGLIVIFAAGLVVAVALFEGIRTNRWGAGEDMEAAARKLDSIPREFGPWVGTDAPIDEKIIRIAEAAGIVSRSYVNRKNGELVNVLLLCGPTGPIGAHTPEYCYGGIGYACKGKPARKGIALADNGHSSFWTARFEKVSNTEEPLRVYWAWSTNGDWQAASNPRSDFALRSVLYKLYVVRIDNSTAKEREPNQEPIELFLADFLPLVKTALTPDQG
jgi:hypothetical protein